MDNFDVTFIEGVPGSEFSPAVIDRANCEGEVTITSNYNDINLDKSGVTVSVSYPTSGGTKPLPAVVPDGVANINLHVKYDGSLIQRTVKEIPLVFYFRSECNGDNVLNQKVDGISVTVVDAQAKPLEIDFNIEHITEMGKNDGSINAILKGGSGNYNFNWVGPNDYSRNGKKIRKIDGLSAGLYTLTLTDLQTGEILEREGYVYNPLSANYRVQNASGKGKRDGVINLTAEGGSGFYRFEWLGPEGFFELDSTPEAQLPEIDSDEHFFEISIGPYQNYLFRNGPEDIDGLGAGLYSVTILDQVTGIRKRNTIQITEPRLEVFVNKVDVSEFGGNDGEIYVEVSKGSGIYQFDWTGPANFISGPNTGSSDHIEDLQAGIYCLRILDSNLNEYAFEKIEIKEPSLTLIRFDVTNPSDDTATDGIIIARLIGGFGPFEWAWSSNPDNDSNILHGVSVGEYTVQAIDTHTGEVIQNQIKVDVENVCSRIQLNLNPTDNSCNNSTTPNGSITTTVIGGSGNYRYTWTGPGMKRRNVSVPNPTNLRGGKYSLTLTDLDTGQTVKSFTQIKNAPFSVFLTGIDPSGPKRRDGRLDVIIDSGCSGQYRYSWFGVEPNCSTPTDGPTLTELREGRYTVKVEDLVTGDIATATATLKAKNENVTTYYRVRNTTGEDERNGKIYMDVRGGSELFDYLWYGEDEFTSVKKNIKHLEEGTYESRVVDRVNNNIITSSVDLIRVGDGIELDAVLEIDHISKFGMNDGSIIVKPSGGKPPYRYMWSRNDQILLDMDKNGIATSLEPGRYTVTIIDSCDNMKTVKGTVASPRPEKLEVCLGGRSITGPDREDGIVFAQIKGGYPPFSYVWYKDGELIMDEDSSPGDGVLSPVGPGEYLVEVADNVCQKEGALIVIPDPGEDPCFGERSFRVEFISTNVVLGPNNTEDEIEINIIRGECCRCCEDPIKVRWYWDSNFTGGVYVDDQMLMWGETKFVKCGESEEVQTLRLKVHYKPNEIGLNNTWPSKQINQTLNLELSSICDGEGTIPTEFIAPEEQVAIRVLNDPNADIDSEYEFKGCGSC